MNKLRQARRLVYMALFVFVSASMLSGCIIAPPYGGYYGGVIMGGAIMEEGEKDGITVKITDCNGLVSMHQ